MSRPLFHAQHVLLNVLSKAHLSRFEKEKVIEQSFKQTRPQKSIFEVRLRVGDVNLILLVFTDGASPRHQQVIQPCYSHDSSGV